MAWVKGWLKVESHIPRAPLTIEEVQGWVNLAVPHYRMHWMKPNPFDRYEMHCWGPGPWWRSSGPIAIG